MDGQIFKEEVFALIYDGEEDGVSTADMAHALALGLYSLYSDGDGDSYRVDGELR